MTGKEWPVQRQTSWRCRRGLPRRPRPHSPCYLFRRRSRRQADVAAADSRSSRGGTSQQSQTKTFANAEIRAGPGSGGPARPPGEKGTVRSTVCVTVVRGALARTSALVVCRWRESYLCSRGEARHGLAVGQTIDAHQKIENITVGGAFEAVVAAAPDSWGHLHACELVGVERTGTFVLAVAGRT